MVARLIRQGAPHYGCGYHVTELAGNNNWQDKPIVLPILVPEIQWTYNRETALT
jgi:hypothetical protein